MAVDTAELADFPHTSFEWVGLRMTYGCEHALYFHVCQVMLPNLTGKLSTIITQSAFKTRHTYHTIIQNFDAAFNEYNFTNFENTSNYTNIYRNQKRPTDNGP
jgi:hypothetical protein